MPKEFMSNFDIIVIGASAGGVESLSKLVANLPSDFPAAIFVVLHFPSFAKSNLPQILSRQGQLEAKHPSDGESIQPGCIYVAPPNYHLLLDRGSIRLTQDPKENGHRPAIDPLFQTAAEAYGKRAIGVVLSGLLDDGTVGLMHIKQQGGIAVVQDPNDAMFSQMPQSAIEYVEVDHILPLAEIAPLLAHLTHQVVPDAQLHARDTKAVGVALMNSNNANHNELTGPPSGFICPDCGGALWELEKNDFLKFRCRVGHTYSQESLLAGQSQELEEALWVAIRLFEERVALLNRLVAQAQDHQRTRSAKRYENKIQSLQRSADLIQKALQRMLETEQQGNGGSARIGSQI